MVKSDKPQLLFFQKMGELYYAIAAADNVVREAEYNTVKEIVSQKWKNAEDLNDAFGKDAINQIEIVFDWFDYHDLDANECFDSFADYKSENQHLFTPERLELIWKTANEIAVAFAGKNKSELIMLAKLKKVLEE